MKNNDGVFLSALLAGVTFLAAPVSQALTEKEVTAINKAISAAPTAELPIKSAEIVARAPRSAKAATGVAVVRAAITKRPAIAVPVVSSIVKAAPSAAPAVAAAAAELAPDQAEDIAVAAVLAAPDLADKSAAAISQANPPSEARVARTVAAVTWNDETKSRSVRSGTPEDDRAGKDHSNSDRRIDADFPFSQDKRDYGSPGHPHHPVHPPHPPHPIHPPHPPHGDGGDHR